MSLPRTVGNMNYDVNDQEIAIDLIYMYIIQCHNKLSDVVQVANQACVQFLAWCSLRVKYLLAAVCMKIQIKLIC